MRVVVLFSGGKDSVYATHLCLSWGWEVEWLTLHPLENSMMFHHPNTDWCELQAKAAGIKWHEVRVTSHENELKELENAIRTLKVDGIVSGAVASEYQKQRIEVIGSHLNLPTYAPLWHKNTDLLREMMASMEMFSRAGNSLNFWSALPGLLFFIFNLLGLVTFRFRETRALTFHQLFEIRYSKSARVLASFLNVLSGLFNFGLLPALASRFFVYFCGFPPNLTLPQR